MDTPDATHPRRTDPDDLFDDTDLDDADCAIAATFDADRDGPVAVVDGYGCRIAVEAGRLVLSDGIADARRVRRYSKGVHSLRRIVLVGHSGEITVAATRWLADAGVAFVQLDPYDGRILVASERRGLEDSRLRRAQVLAADTPLGLGIARHLLVTKLEGHVAIARNVFGADDTAATITDFADQLDRARHVEDLRSCEAQAAAAYFALWPQHNAIRFLSKDAKRVPPHWQRFDGRRSVLRRGNGNQRAERPVNALLNFLYRLAEIECRLALLTVGLDPSFGFLHADYPGRDALSLDLLEVCRPEVERYVLRVLADHRFRKSDFVEGPDGHVRILAPLTHQLADTMDTWAQVVAPHAETIAHTIAEDVPGRIVKRTPLTGRRRRDAAARVRAARSNPTKPPVPVSVCEGCGTSVVRRGYLWCETCRPDVKREAARKARAAQVAARQARRAAGIVEASSTPEARAKLGAAIGRRDAEATAWDAAHPDVVVDRADFAPIAAKLAELTGPAIAKATGLSKTHADGIRRGRYVPHPRHWPALADLAGVPCPFDNTARPGSLDLTWWHQTVVPALSSVTTTAVEQATGLSGGQASKIRRGIGVPHPRHWPALAELAGVEGPS